MVAIRNLFLFATAASALVIERRATAAAILADLKTIDTDTKNLNSAIKSWDGTTFGALNIQTAENDLDKKIQSTTSDAQGSSTFSTTDAQNTINYINNTLEPDVKAALNELVSRKSDVTKAGLTSEVQSDLSSLKSDTDKLATALINVTPSSLTSAAKSAQAKLDADFQSAINSFA